MWSKATCGGVFSNQPSRRMHFRSKWLIAAATGLALSCGNDSPTPVAPTPTPPAQPGPSESLKTAAAERGKLVGTAVQATFLGNPPYNTVVDREFNYLTAEYEM